jgi:hypothetical protein
MFQLAKDTANHVRSAVNEPTRVKKQLARAFLPNMPALTKYM